MVMSTVAFFLSPVAHEVVLLLIRSPLREHLINEFKVA